MSNTQRTNTQTQTRPQNGGLRPPNKSAGGVIATVKTGDLIQELLDRPHTEKTLAIGAALEARIERIEEMLPDFMKGQGKRLAKRAQMTFDQNNDLWDCPPQDFVRCVLEAAEMGFAIDGKLCYVVRYKKRFQCQLDYKAVVAVSKRMKTIKDIYADVVCENDSFEAYRQNGSDHLFHKRPTGKGTADAPLRGDVIGAYAVVILADTWRFEFMDREELDKIQARAPSKSGPWSSDPDEMRRKTVIRKTLKMYADDPSVQRVLELTDEEVEIHDDTPNLPAKVTTGAALAERLSQTQKSPSQTSSQTRQDAIESTSQEDGQDAGGDDEGPFDDEQGEDLSQTEDATGKGAPKQQEDIKFG